MRSIPFFFIIAELGLSACSQNPEYDYYKGRALRVAVDDESPEIFEVEVKSSTITLDELPD